MIKSELIEKLAIAAEINRNRAEHIVNCIFESMIRALQNEERIEIRGFGSFTVRKYNGYQGRNPKTGKIVSVPPKRLPFFKPGRELKELVDNSRFTENNSS
jgi:integration host factor subunit beta